MRFDHPIISIDTSRIDFTLIEDTVSTPIKYTFVKDTLDIKKYYIDFDLIEDKKYILETISDMPDRGFLDPSISFLGKDFDIKFLFAALFMFLTFFILLILKLFKFLEKFKYNY